ncbi:MAG: SRPBCC family protein [Solirubrobacteraceae bacterium]
MSTTEKSISERSTVHSTFVIERTYPASPERVFAAWSDQAAKAQWFGRGEKYAESYSLDFREGGREHLSVTAPDGAVYSFDAVYADIVSARRIVHTYDMHRDDARISVSVATIEFEAVDDGTRLTLTEQGVFLDGLDTPAEREHGTNALLDALGSHLQRGERG